MNDMSNRSGMQAVILCVAGILGAALVGCVGNERESRTRQTAQLAPGVDPQRAFATLDEIAPASPAPANTNTTPEQSKPLSERGSAQVATARKLIGEQRYTEAALELERALRYDPGHPEIQRTLAQMHWQAGNLERAKSHAERTLEVRPGDGLAHYIVGRCHAAAGAHAKAIPAYRAGLREGAGDGSPESQALCHYYLAESLAAEGYLSASLAEYEAYEREAGPLVGKASQPELVALLQANGGSAGAARSDLLERLGRFAEAADALAPAVAAAPKESGLSLRYGRLLMNAGRLTDALAVVRGISSDEEEVLALLAAIHERAGAPGRFIEDLRVRLAARPGDARLVRQLADQLVKDGRGAEARRELAAYLDRHPEVTDVRLRLIALLLEQSAWDEALRLSADGMERQPARAGELEGALATIADNEPALDVIVAGRTAGEPTAVTYLRGALAARAGRNAPAEALLRDALSTDPRFAPAKAALARMYLADHRYEEALAAAARVDPDVADDARLELLLAQTHERLDDAGAAELHFKATLQLDRQNSEAMFALAQLYARTDRALQAQRQVRTLLEHDPGHEAAREMLAMSYLQDGKHDAAMEQFRELQRLAESPTVRARAQVVIDNFPRVDPRVYREALLEAQEGAPPDVANWIAIAESYDENSEAQERYDAYLRALEADPKNEDAAVGVINAAQRLLRFEESIARLEELMPQRPRRHAWLRRLIGLYWVVQRYDAALEQLERLSAQHDLDEPTRTHYWLMLVDTLRLSKRPEDAITRLQVFAEAYPGNREWITRRAELYRQEQRPAEAAVLYESLYQADGNDRRVLNELIETLNEAKRPERAMQYALNVIAQDPTSDQATALLALALAEPERVDDAAELIRNTLLHTNNREAFQNLLVLRLRRAERHGDAIDLIESLLDRAMEALQGAVGQGAGEAGPPRDREVMYEPNQPLTAEKLADRVTELRFELAIEHVEAGQYRDAEQLLLSWLEHAQDPGARLRFLVALGSCYQNQGDDLRSTETMAKALVLSPDNVGLNNDVAYGYIDRGVNMAEAERMIRFALSSAPREGAYLDTYGWLLYKKGDFAEARVWLERAAHERSEGDPVVLDHLGDACWQVGDRQAAIAHWTAALDALKTRKDEEILAADMRRVRDTTPGKLEAARAGETPSVAPVAEPEEPAVEAESPSAPVE